MNSRKTTFLIIWGSIIFSSPLLAEKRLSEDKIKAGYLFQFTHYVDIIKPNQEITFCIYGNEVITKNLRPLTNNQDQPQLANIKTTLNNIDRCNILYIDKSKKDELKSILARLNEKPTLTVSNIPNFVKKGGMIGFVNLNKRIRIEINRAPANRSHIKYHAKLLEVAIKVINQ